MHIHTGDCLYCFTQVGGSCQPSAGPIRTQKPSCFLKLIKLGAVTRPCLSNDVGQEEWREGRTEPIKHQRIPREPSVRCSAATEPLLQMRSVTDSDPRTQSSLNHGL
ncbi:hypothetical protein SKAU_G00230290 [Synaphobranchus kaupii]|uniref:Uncharacterized protein n=1 Tax=Synaphobranchus kaupii TaxID=118154 RepID=A0A9Q1F5N0_SYNKA|nr:hypothetical protein SKAU_G00230290 [Synaphobranchus kaupii]